MGCLVEASLTMSETSRSLIGAGAGINAPVLFGDYGNSIAAA